MNNRTCLLILSVGLLLAICSLVAGAVLLLFVVATVTPAPSPQFTPIIEGMLSPITETSTPSPMSTWTPWRQMPTSSPTPTTTPPLGIMTSVPQLGWVQYQDQANGYSIALPTHWRRIDLDSQTRNTFTGQSGLDPQVLKFIAIDPSGDSTTFTTNLNLMKEILQLAVSLDFYVQISVAKLEASSGIIPPVSHQRVMIGGEPAERIEYGYRAPDNSGVLRTLGVMQFVYLKGRETFVLTLVSLSDRYAEYRTTFEQIGQSFRFAGGSSPLQLPTSTLVSLNVPTNTPTLSPTRSSTLRAGNIPLPTPNCPDPQARITSPPMDARLSGIVEVRGTANIDDFLYYKVQFIPDAGLSTGSWMELYKSSRRVVDGKLMDWHTYTVSPDVYWLRLLVHRTDGQYPEPCMVRVVVVR